MKLLLLARGLYQVMAACSDREACHLLSFLDELEGKFQDQADRMIHFLERVAHAGPPRNTDFCHKIQNDIWQFESGRIRILWFYGEGRRVIVCSHGFFKTTPKTPRRQINQAMRIRHQYLQDVAAGNIVIWEDQDDE